MRNGRFSALIVTMVISWSGLAQAANLVFNLSSPDNLSNLTVGQSFTVQVSLSNLAAGEELVSLVGGVNYSSLLLSSPTSITAGAIIPNPLANPLDFQTVANPGQADAAFITFSNNSAEHITANGVFYQFTLTAQSVGSGQIDFTLPALIGEQYDPQDPNLPILRFIDAGTPLSFTITSNNNPGPSPIPLPAALGMGLVGGILAMHRAGRRGDVHDQMM